MASYGDIGVRFNNPIIGEHILKTNIYTSMENDISGITCQSYFDNSFECIINEEIFEPTGVANNDVCLSSDISLQNYPNPFNPVTTISYNLPFDSDVSVEIYNIKGQKVRTLLNEQISKGQHSIIWNGVNEYNQAVSSGVYFYKLVADDKTISSGKMMLIK
jgi:hypothetical protein